VPAQHGGLSVSPHPERMVVQLRRPAKVWHPGTFLEEELKARRWARCRLALLTNIPASTIDKLITGQLSVTADMSKSLARASGTSTDYWVNLQYAYDAANRAEERNNADD